MRSSLCLLLLLCACEVPDAPETAAPTETPEAVEEEPRDQAGDVYEYGDVEVWDVALTAGEFGLQEVTGTARHSQRGTADYVEVSGADIL